MDKYFIRARLYPTLITIIPAIIFYYFTLGTKLNDAMGYIIAVPIILHLTVAGSLIYGLTQLNRFIGKEVFQKLYFKEEVHMPTTDFLLFKNSVLSRDMKTKLRNKIKNDFQIGLLTEQQEMIEELEARKQIVFAVSQIKSKIRANSLLLQHNIEYGFVRNLVGGSVLAALFCLINLYFFSFVFPNPLAYTISFGLLLLYAIVIICSKWIISQNGRAYAKILYEQFLITP